MSIMIRGQIEFHDTAALESVCGLPGMHPTRIPRGVRETLNPGAQRTGCLSTGIELRFVTEASHLRVALSAQDAEVQVHVHRGEFSPDVWRVMFSGGMVNFLGLDTSDQPCRPPEAEEKLRLRWLAYGSSITNSWAKGYPHQAARRLGADVLNKGLSGSCRCESTLADYFAAEETWDFATLELG